MTSRAYPCASALCSLAARLHARRARRARRSASRVRSSACGVISPPYCTSRRCSSLVSQRADSIWSARSAFEALSKKSIGRGERQFFSLRTISGVERLCTRWVIIDHGRVPCDGPASDLARRHAPFRPLDRHATGARPGKISALLLPTSVKALAILPMDRSGLVRRCAGY